MFSNAVWWWPVLQCAPTSPDSWAGPGYQSMVGFKMCCFSTTLLLCCLPFSRPSLILHLCWSVCYLAILVSIQLTSWVHLLAFYVALLYSPKLLDNLNLETAGRGLYSYLIPQNGMALSTFQSLPFWKWWEPMGNGNNPIKTGWQRIYTIRG